MMRNQYTLCERLRKCKSNPNDSKFHLTLRFCIVASFLIAIGTLKFTGALSFKSPECIDDSFFTLTAGMNQYLADRPQVLDSLIIMTSLNIDLSMVIFAFLFVYYYRSWRLTIWSGIFYGSRSIIQTFFKLRIPSSYEWHYPNFPSIFVPYSMGDFFYSGHAGLMLAVSIQFYKYRYYWLSFFVSLCNVYNCIILVVTRSHYSLDIVGGLVFSHYFYILAGYACQALQKVGVYEVTKMHKVEESTEELIVKSHNDQVPHFTEYHPVGLKEDHIKSSPSSYEAPSLKQKLISADN